MNLASSITHLDEALVSLSDKPGAQLAIKRQEKGYSADYVANKLHLRVKLIELLEADQYAVMPEPVFIKGYLRAYANLLDISPEPLLETFNRLYAKERKFERALWQSRRQTHGAEHAVRWLTGLIACGVLVAVAFWWQNNKENEHVFAGHLTQATTLKNQSETEIRLTDLSKMRSLLSSPVPSSETQGG